MKPKGRKEKEAKLSKKKGKMEGKKKKEVSKKEKSKKNERLLWKSLHIVVVS
jgi:hypothetical protein